MSVSTNSPLSRAETIALSTTFGLVAFSIILGNSLTIAAFTKTRLLRRPAHYFLISLAVADMMAGALAMPLYISHFIDVDLWGRSQILQVFYYTLDIMSGMTSVFTLVVVSVERLYAVGWPWKYRHSTSLRVYALSILATWLLAATISCLYLAFRFNLISDVVHVVTVILLSISLIITCTCYGGVWARVKQRRKRCRRFEKDRRLATTLCVVTSVFILTWAPFEIIIILVHFCKKCRLPPHRLVYVIKLLQYSNSLVNMLVYSFRMPEFRKAILSFLKSGSFNYKRNNTQERKVAAEGIAISSVSGFPNSCSCSPVNEHVIRTGCQCEKHHKTKGKSRLARARTDLFSMR